MITVSLADAKARLSELVNRVEAGDAVEITRRGKRVALLTAASAQRQPVDVEALKAVTDAMPLQDEDAETFIRKMRDGERY